MSVKSVIFKNGNSEICSLAPAFHEALSVMVTLPDIAIEIQAETLESPRHVSVREVVATWRDETADEIALRAANCALSVGTGFSIVDLENIPDPLDVIENFDFESIGREAIEARWISAANEINETHQSALASALEAAARENEASIAAWIEAHQPPAPPIEEIVTNEELSEEA